MFARVEYNGVRTHNMAAFGADDGYPLLQEGELATGRWFTRSEMTSGSPVVVLSEKSAMRVFGEEPSLGKWVRVGGRRRIGIAVGLLFGQIVTRVLGIDAPVPLLLTFIAVAVSVAIGIVLGMIPARRAAYLDPIEALRHE